MAKQDVKQDAKQAVKKVAASAEKNVKKMMQNAERELAKVRKEMDKHLKQVEGYVKKNPEKASLISAGIGAALGASVAMLIKTKKAAKKKKK